MKRNGLCVEAIDPLFFRDSSSFDAGETLYLRCLFPPTPSSAYGLARGFILESLCKELNHYIYSGCKNCSNYGNCVASGIVGSPSLRDGTLQIRGPYVYRDGMCWYSAPIDLVSKNGKLYSGTVSDTPTLTDLGKLCLPSAGGEGSYISKSETHLISQRSMAAYLAGLPLSENDIVPLAKDSISTIECDTQQRHTQQNGFVTYELRTGIARDPVTNTTIEAHLYNIQLVRMMNDTRLLITIDGLDGHENELVEMACLPFGGENRLVKVYPIEYCSAPVSVTDEDVKQNRRFKLVLLNHADFDGSWLPPGLTKEQNEQGATTWSGKLNGIPVRLISAMTGKSILVGGWDIAAKKPRPLRSLVPAGSVYYFESLDTSQSVIKALHDKCIGNNTQHGLGHVAVGVW